MKQSNRFYHVLIQKDWQDNPIYFAVSDITPEELQQGVTRPKLAEFPVSTLHSIETQRRNAWTICEILNGTRKIVDLDLKKQESSQHQVALQSLELIDKKADEDPAAHDAMTSVLTRAMTHDVVMEAVKKASEPEKTHQPSWWFVLLFVGVIVEVTLTIAFALQAFK